MIYIDPHALVDFHTAQGHIVKALSSALERIARLEEDAAHERQLSVAILEDAIRAKAALKSYVIVEILDGAFTAIDKRVKKMEWDQGN